MKKIPAMEIRPKGIDTELLSVLEDNEKLLELDNATIYYGFPVYRDYNNAQLRASITILSPKHGIIMLITSVCENIEAIDAELSQLYVHAESSMRKSKILRATKSMLRIPIDCFLYAEDAKEEVLENLVLRSTEQMLQCIKKKIIEKELDKDVMEEARAVLEGAKAMPRPAKRIVKNPDAMNKQNILIKLEEEVSNFDVEQRKVAISLIKGPQRIRGLAGSGKTVVLAMKAANIHMQYPDRSILFTFYTKSLYGLIKNTISRFYRHYTGEEPNWKKIDILHAWGGRSIEGVCSNAAIDNDTLSVPFYSAKKANPSDPFMAVCKHIEKADLEPKYDYILVDEAQDLPDQFFRICYKLAKGGCGKEKNIVWAYDELQSIFNVYQRTPKELFGEDEYGNPRIDLDLFRSGLQFGQDNDLVLYRCYRNPLDILLTAHALGFAIYSDQPVQMLENREHWHDVGYIVEGDKELTVGEKVSILRPSQNSPLSIYEHQNSKDLIKTYDAKSFNDECNWICDEILTCINDEGLNPDDIMVISMDDRNARAYFSNMSVTLLKSGVKTNNLLISRLAAPPFSLPNMVTLSTVHRAKGNEAAVVFAVGMDALFPIRRSRQGRNRIFTAFTRAKGWLYATGIGFKAGFFFKEMYESMANSPALRFVVPDSQYIDTIQRDMMTKDTEVLHLIKDIEKLQEMGYTKEQIEIEIQEAMERKK